MSKITGRDKRVAEWLWKIGINPTDTRRVVIDIPCDGPVYMYIERFGNSRIFEVEPPPELTTAIRLVPPQDDFEEAIKIIKGLKVGEQPIISSDEGTDWKEEPETIQNLKKEDTPTPEWLEEFRAKQRAAIQKWEFPND